MMHRDSEATEQAGFSDPRSFVCLTTFRIHPGTNHPCVYLYGALDVGRRRQEVAFLANYRCHYCGDFCKEKGEMHHVVGGLGAQRCYCFENLRWTCHDCHEKITREDQHH